MADSQLGRSLLGDGQANIAHRNIHKPRDLYTQSKTFFKSHRQILVILNDSLFDPNIRRRLKDLVEKSLKAGSECIFVLDQVSPQNRELMRRSLQRTNGYYVFDLALAWRNWQEEFTDQKQGLASQMTDALQEFKENAIVVGLISLRAQRRQQQLQTKEEGRPQPRGFDAATDANAPEHLRRLPRRPGPGR